MDAEGLGRKLLLTPPATLGEPWKADCGYCDSISQNANPASTFELSILALQKEAAWAEARHLSPLRQSVPQNGRVHLLGLEASFAEYRKKIGDTIAVFFWDPEKLRRFCIFKVAVFSGSNYQMNWNIFLCNWFCFMTKYKLMWVLIM